jgi:beta-lactamase regulating signal transducer with metallopeptidase domain
LNRILLLLIAPLALTLPVLTITLTQEIPLDQTENFTAIIEESFLTSANLQYNSSKVVYTQENLLPFIALVIYIIGASFLAFKKIVGVIQIVHIRKSSQKMVFTDYTLCIVKESVVPFSWFGSIILSSEDYSKNREMIIEHEKAHIALGHSYDLVFINIIQIFQWFNPFVWLIRKELIDIHEFQADNCVLTKGIDATKYQYLLITKGAANYYSIPVANNLCSGNFKQRIKMMLKRRSSPHKAMRALLLIPFLAVAVLVFAKKEYVSYPATSFPDLLQQQVSIKSDETYVLGVWSDKNSDNNFEAVAKADFSNAINSILPRFKYPKDSIIAFVKFEEIESSIYWLNNISLIEKVLTNAGIKTISVHRPDKYQSVDIKKRLNIIINDKGDFMVNNEIINDVNYLQSVIKSQIDKMDNSPKNRISVIVHTSTNTPEGAITTIKSILKDENITNIHYRSGRINAD